MNRFHMTWPRAPDPSALFKPSPSGGCPGSDSNCHLRVHYLQQTSIINIYQAFKVLYNIVHIKFKNARGFSGFTCFVTSNQGQLKQVDNL